MTRNKTAQLRFVKAEFKLRKWKHNKPTSKPNKDRI